MPTLSEALARLRAFHDTFNAGDAVDEESGLMADDLSVIIEAAEAFEEGAPAADPR